jgi:hypothetical protein
VSVCFRKIVFCFPRVILVRASWISPPGFHTGGGFSDTRTVLIFMDQEARPIFMFWQWRFHKQTDPKVQNITIILLQFLILLTYQILNRNGGMSLWF